jgi:signal transduction histidine kinase
MIKVLTITCFLILFCNASIAQSKKIDSLKIALANTTNPVERFDILNNLSLELAGWKGIRIDSGYCIEMLQIAQKLDSDSLLAISYNWLSSFFYLNKGDNTTGLEYIFKAVPLAEKAKDKRRISSLYFDIALIYFDLQSNEEALKYTLKGAENLPDKSHPLYDYMLVQYQSNMAQYFLTVKQPDSATYYITGMSETNQRLNGGTYDIPELTFKAEAYALKGNLSLADQNYQEALKLVDSVDNGSVRVLFYNHYIPFLLSSNRVDEAATQSKYCLALAMRDDNSNMKMIGAGFLRRVFEIRHQLDSAYYYSSMEADFKAVIFNQNNNNKIQALAFKENLRSYEEERKKAAYRNQLRLYALLGGLGVFLTIATILYINNRLRQKTNKELEATLSNLRATQSQLIQSEKMASLGELTAGIAHEIQNPLNFVNNFSEVSSELVNEMNIEMDKGNTEDAKLIARDLKQNLEKINHHGKRAGDIIKGMLQHSRSSTGKKELTDINKLTDEYLRLAYHGLRVKNKSFNATIKTDFDETIGNINIIPQDIGRVVLNLINNAFYAVSTKASTSADGGYEPTVSVSTKKVGDKVLISVKDNGNGIPQKVLDKIFQPFFTTKPTGQGTGLGLSLSYDIVKAHGGELKVETREGEGSKFIINLPA